METVTVIDTRESPRGGGWYEVELEGGEVASTRDRKVLDAAFQSKNTPVEAEINRVQNGKFENVYLNGIAGVTDGKAKPSGTNGSSRTTPARSAPARSDETGERIARQWSYGRAVELLAAIGPATGPGDVLNDEDKHFLTSTAEFLLSKTK